VTDTGSGLEPRFSDDRQWWWDGTQWVPASQAPVPPPPTTQASVAPPRAEFASIGSTDPARFGSRTEILRRPAMVVDRD
jgi:hypothetical protein